MRAFSGIKPSGDLHIGNYFGSIAQWVAQQHENEGLYCVVDMHAITVPQKPEELRARTHLIAAAYLAAGLDPKKNLIFVQSHVPEHAELAWMLNCTVRMSELERMTQYKDAMAKSENPSVGMFDYPVLMAADILLYDTDTVPVGHDQVQHVELACDIANRFNRDFGPTFKIPKAVMQKVGARIMSLDDPMKKMSKSDKNTILLMDDADVIRKKISRAMTDSIGTIAYDKSRPGISNLIEIYHHASGMSISDIVAKYEGKGYRDFKADLAEHLVTLLVPLQAKIAHYLENRTELENILRDGAHRARQIAEAKMKMVKEKIGFAS
jgi:tryptophanyl-tRNA synthetase